MRRILLITGAVASCLGAAGLLVGGRLNRALHQAPPFYEAALAVEPRLLEHSSRSFERRVAALYTDWQHQRPWHAAFSVEEINGWLATALPTKFPGLLPEGVINPRIAAGDGTLLLAFRLQKEGFESPISVEFEVFVTETDLLAVRFCRARAGSLPLPMVRIVEQASAIAMRRNWAVRWTRHEGDPVALAPLRGLVCGNETRRELDRVEIADNEIILSGGVAPLSAALALPRSAPDLFTR